MTVGEQTSDIRIGQTAPDVMWRMAVGEGKQAWRRNGGEQTISGWRGGDF